MIEPFAGDERKTVFYIPSHALGDLTHVDIEQGVITSWNELYVFVRYTKDQLRSQATSRCDLMWEDAFRAAKRLQGLEDGEDENLSPCCGAEMYDDCDLCPACKEHC
jgi:hypothetical protein